MKLTTLFILLACCLAFQTQASTKAQEAAELTMAGWTLEERLALGLYQVSQGHLSPGIATLEDTKDAELDPEARERLDRATRRAKQLLDSRDRLMRWAVDNKKSLRWPLDDKMVVLKAKSWKDGLLTVRKSKKHELTELRAGEMTMAFLAANFKKKSDDFGADWLEGYCRAMSDDPQWQAALPKKFAQEVLFAADMDQAKQLRAAGPFLTALMEGVQGQGTATMDFERWSRTVKSTRWLGHRKPLLLELATRSFHAQVQDQGLAAAMNASVEELKNGRMRFTYTFSSDSELADFSSDDRWWKREREAYGLEIEENETPEIDDGKLMLNGAQSLAHVLEFEGDMSLQLNYRHEYDVNAEQLRIGTVMPVVNASPPFHFARSSFGLLLAIDGPKSKPNQKQTPIDDGEFRVDKAIQTKLWTSKKKAHLRYNGHDESQVDFIPNRAGTAVIWVHSEYPIGFDTVVIEGRPTQASREALAQRWLTQQIESLGLAPTK